MNDAVTQVFLPPKKQALGERPKDDLLACRFTFLSPNRKNAISLTPLIDCGFILLLFFYVDLPVLLPWRIVLIRRCLCF